MTPRSERGARLESLRPAHAKALSVALASLRRNPATLGVIVGGSVAHGFASGDSDLDLIVVVSDDAYERRARSGKLLYMGPAAIASYLGACSLIDGKYASPSFIERVASGGSEPARFAFKDAIVAWSRMEGLEGIVERAQRYPIESKESNLASFCAQLEAWAWYAGEAEKREDPYLLARSISNVALFSGRIVLARNNTLFPYHKWFMRCLEQAHDRPPGLPDAIRRALASPSADNAAQILAMMKRYHRFPLGPFEWPSVFMKDSELAWMEGRQSIEDR
jgi:hypothetical protein